MEPLARVEQLARTGRYREALDALDKIPKREFRAYDLIRSELLEVLGKSAECRKSVDAFLSGRSLADAEKGRAEFVVSRLCAETGNLESEFKYLQKAIFHSERAKDLKSTCISQVWLLALVADRSGPDAARTVMLEARKNVTKLGDPVVTAMLHLFVAEMDGKRGLLKSAVNHTQISVRVLETHPHLWLQGWAHNNLLALAILKSDFEKALEHGQTALALSTECGASASIRRTLGNLGRLHLCLGSFDTALEYLHRAMAYSSSTNEHVNGTLDSIARVYLAQGKPELGLELIRQIEQATQLPDAAGRYVHRHSLLTKAELLLHLKRPEESVECLNTVAQLARTAGDHPLAKTASFLLVEASALKGSCPVRVEPPAGGPDASSELCASYERALATALGSHGARASWPHYKRAMRIFSALGNVPAKLELERAWTTVTARQDLCVTDQSLRAQEVLQSAATLMVHAGQPEILATELVALLEQVGITTGALAIARDERGHEQTLAAFGARPLPHDARTITLGTSRQRIIDVRLTPLDDTESQATLNSVSMLLGIAAELERARAEREERLTLWPIEQLPEGDDDSIILGEMGRLMTQARRIANTNVVVLITGESGTGKEVLARAIHGYSPRARKPFVPFNCTAIARDLVESQLFGHRRGAFTGADRDMQGLVRAAKDGTLFLDEVGEMALDLQPKLLRFLESGEINPLGESSPFTVDVRIIAATNADLETLVAQGRFREDLYYRLNVVRLTVPPLRERRDEIPALVHHFVAKAALEFGKQRVNVAEETMEQLLLYSWPGNVRQLQNELRRIVAMADNESVLVPAVLSKAIRQEAMLAGKAHTGAELVGSLADKLEPTLSRIEREMIKAALTANQGKLEATAKALGISRKGLYLKRQRLGV